MNDSEIMPTPDRDEAGRLLPGHRLPGPGNPGAPNVVRFKQLLEQAITIEDVVEAIEVLRVAMRDTTARWRDRIAAAGELLNRRLGRPSQSIEILRTEPDEYIIRMSKAVTEFDFEALASYRKSILGEDISDEMRQRIEHPYSRRDALPAPAFDVQAHEEARQLAERRADAGIVDDTNGGA